jgi:hypothetical protein
MTDLTPAQKRAITAQMIEEVTLDFVVANDREPRDKQELAEWCKVPVL